MGRPFKNTVRTTQDDIIESARAYFLAQGFAGTSISEIANSAKVAKSLIYHHFSSKVAIWKAVKEQIIKESIGEEWALRDFDTSTLEGFLNDFVSFRFYLYADNPDLVTLMQWQKLEKSEEAITGLSKGIINVVEEKIKRLQLENKVRQDISSEIVTYIITSSASNPFSDQVSFLKDEIQQQIYLKFIIKSLLQILIPN